MIDDQYLDLRSCNDESVNAKTYRKIGLGKCYEKILWFTEEKDFNIVTYDPDSYDIERNDVESNKALKQTSAGASSLEIKKTISLKASYSSKFLEKIRSIIDNEHRNGTNGFEIIAISNGGFWFEEGIIFNEGEENEYTVKYVYPYLKTSKFPSVISGNYKDDTEIEMEFLVEEFPKTYTIGTVPIGYGIPKEFKPIKIEHGNIVLTETDLNIPQINFIDEDFLTDIDITNKVLITLYESKTNLKLYEEAVQGNLTDFVKTFENPLDEIIVEIRYFLKSNETIPYEMKLIKQEIATPTI